MTTLKELYCLLFGNGITGVLVSVVAGGAVMLYFTLLALNEGRANVSGAIKLAVVLSALTSLTSIINSIFGFSTSLC